MTIFVEKHKIKKSHEYYQQCDELAWKAKNIYNVGLFITRQHFFDTKKFLSKKQLYHKVKTHHCYQQLPKKVGAKVLFHIEKNYKSFFGKLKAKLKASIPRYHHKIKGRQTLVYERDAIGKRHFKNTGEIKLSQTDITIKTQITDWDKIRQVRVVPKKNHYVIEVLYIADKYTPSLDNTKVAAIDLGLNNLATMVYNDASHRPFIMNGRPLKSINQYYNKKKAKLQKTMTR